MAMASHAFSCAWLMLTLRHESSLRLIGSLESVHLLLLVEVTALRQSFDNTSILHYIGINASTILACYYCTCSCLGFITRVLLQFLPWIPSRINRLFLNFLEVWRAKLWMNFSWHLTKAISFQSKLQMKLVKKLWKHSPAARVPTAFLVLPNFHECFYNSTETRRTWFLFLLENIATKKGKQLFNFDDLNVNSLWSRHHYVNSSC